MPLVRSILVRACALSALGAGCADAPPTPGSGPFPFEPPPVYRRLWSDVEQCSGRRGDPDRVRWLMTDSFPGQPLRLAQWEPGHVITLRSDMDVALPIVAHEILHDLLGGDGANEDPAWLECALPVAGAGGGDRASRDRAGRDGPSPPGGP